MSTVLIDSLTRTVALAGRKREHLEARSDESLVRELVRAWDDDLFRILVQRYKDRVFRLAASVLGPGRAAEAEDVAQEVFLLVYRKIDTFRHDSGFATWLYRTARNRALDHRQQPRLRYPHVGDDEIQSLPAAGRCNDPERVAVDRERRARILGQIERLPDPQRTIVHLYYWMGSSVAGIAELLEMKTETVKSHLHRARRGLAQRLKRAGVGHV